MKPAEYYEILGERFVRSLFACMTPAQREEAERLRRRSENVWSLVRSA